MKKLRQIWLIVVLMASAMGASPAASHSEGSIDILGTWFVLIHYIDPDSAHPKATRWRDLVWVFAEKGSRLEWTEYPLVIFEDQTGRFEAIAGNPRSRVLQAWKPTPEQQQTLQKGPRVNERGARRKTLRGSKDGGWQSSRRRVQTSASVMGYHETLTIEGLQGLPLFQRQDVVGNAATRTEGEFTRYQVTQILGDGRRMQGRYEKDGRLTGTFEMRRTDAARGLKKQDKTPNERAAEALQRSLEASPDPSS